MYKQGPPPIFGQANSSFSDSEPEPESIFVQLGPDYTRLQTGLSKGPMGLRKTFFLGLRVPKIPPSLILGLRGEGSPKGSDIGYETEATEYATSDSGSGSSDHAQMPRQLEVAPHMSGDLPDNEVIPPQPYH